MKLQSILFCLTFAIGACAQTNVNLFKTVPAALALGNGPISLKDSMSSWWTWHKTNISFIVDTPQPCPLEYTNVISNTNLFSPNEQRLMKELALKYGKVTIDSPPAGTRLVKKAHHPGNIILSAYKEVRWEATNSEAQIRAFFMKSGFNRGKEKLAELDFIKKSGEGDEAIFGLNGRCIGLLQLKHGQPDGLWVDIFKGHCVALAHYKNGMLVGKYLVWNKSGTLYMEAQFKKPYDFLHHMTLSE